MTMKTPATAFILFSASLLYGCPSDDAPMSEGSTGSDSSDTSTTEGPITTLTTTAADDTSSSGVDSTGDTGSTSDTDSGSSSSGSDSECGDRIVEGDEECDDGGESATCDADCTAVECGDSVVNEAAGEVCDDGGRSPACNADCTLAGCGDGVVNLMAGEACDDMGESPTCNVDCSVASCGDGVINTTAGEACDDMGESANCDSDCTASSCGDGTLNTTADEECDDMGESATCDVDCTIAQCGDGVLNMAAGEECDDGNIINDDGCSNTCTLAVSASCADLLTNQALWGMAASTGVDLVQWTSSTLHWIGCPGDGCSPGSFYCNYDPIMQTLTFGTTEFAALRSSVDPGNVLGDALAGPFTGCCNAPGGLCNAPNTANNGVAVDMVGALCTALGYSSGMVLREEGDNSCPEPHAVTADGQQWTSDFVNSDGFGAEYMCVGFL